MSVKIQTLLYSLSYSAMLEISVILICTISILRYFIIIIIFVYTYICFNTFLYVYGLCVCNKDILLLLA